MDTVDNKTEPTGNKIPEATDCQYRKPSPKPGKFRATGGKRLIIPNLRPHHYQ